MHREIRDLVRKLEQQGWRIRDGKKHLMAFPPDKTKEPVSIPKTPSDHRSLKNTVAKCRNAGAVL